MRRLGLPSRLRLHTVYALPDDLDKRGTRGERDGAPGLNDHDLALPGLVLALAVVVAGGLVLGRADDMRPVGGVLLVIGVGRGLAVKAVREARQDGGKGVGDGAPALSMRTPVSLL